MLYAIISELPARQGSSTAGRRTHYSELTMRYPHGNPGMAFRSLSLAVLNDSLD